MAPRPTLPKERNENVTRCSKVIITLNMVTFHSCLTGGRGSGRKTFSVADTNSEMHDGDGDDSNLMSPSIANSSMVQSPAGIASAGGAGGGNFSHTRIGNTAYDLLTQQSIQSRSLQQASKDSASLHFGIPLIRSNSWAPAGSASKSAHMTPRNQRLMTVGTATHHGLGSATHDSSGMMSPHSRALLRNKQLVSDAASSTADGRDGSVDDDEEGEEGDGDGDGDEMDQADDGEGEDRGFSQLPEHKQQAFFSSNVNTTSSTSNALQRSDSANQLDASSFILENDSASTLKPYSSTNQLEYLEDNFQMIALMIKGEVTSVYCTALLPYLPTHSTLAALCLLHCTACIFCR